jgi:tetratricopeptide (TPR) repeat protein
VSAEAVAQTRNRYQDFPAAVAGVLEERAGILAEKNDPKKADPLFRQALDLAGKHYWAGAREMAELRARIALARLAAGDRIGHRGACEALLKDFGKTSDPATAARVVRACALTSGIPADSLLGLAAAPVVFLKNEPACVFALTAALYRAGKYDEAARRLREARLAETPLETHGDLLLAMCLHHLGKKGEARAALAKVAARLDAASKPNAAQPFAWDELVELKTLRREAEELLGGKGPG